MSELPEGWAEATLRELSEDISYGFTTSATSENNMPRLLRITDLQDNSVDWDRVPYCSEEPNPKFDLRNDDIVVARTGATTGKNYLISTVPGRTVFASYLIRIRTAEGVKPAYVSQFMKSPNYWGHITRVSKGVAQPGANATVLGELEVPLPPLAEQNQIVSKLDTLSARTTTARTDLTAIAKLAERYRTSVLKLAFEGVLTTDWRASHKIGKSASQETKRMLEEQRQALVDENGKQRKSRSAKADSHRIPVELSHPSEWVSTTMEEITSPLRLIQYGILKPGPDEPGGVPYVKVMNIKGGVVELEKIRHTTREIHQQYMRSSLKTGDLLLTIRGTVGRMAFVPESLDGGNITQDTVRIDILETMSSAFVFWYFHSPKAQKYFRENQKGVAVRGINVGDVRPMEVPLPSRAEQNEIVRTIENAFAKIDRLATEAEKALKLTDRLDQRILAKAFAGELVPQDPNDEPASALLERIFEARDKAPRTKKRRSRGERTATRVPRKNAAMTKSRQDEDVLHKPYLATLLKESGEAQGAEDLFKQSQLPVADFYKQLAWEVDQGHIKDQQELIGCDLMRLDRAYFDGFKNLKNTSVEFDESRLTTVVIGENGSGKSNLIEAITDVFRFVDINRGIPSYTYDLEYRIKNHTVRFSNRKSEPIIEVDGAKISRATFERDKSDIFPDLVFGYYSGGSRRLERLFDPHQRRYYGVIKRNSDVEACEQAQLARRLFYCRPIHGVLALLSFFAFPDSAVRALLKEKLGITGFHSALATFRAPSWFRESQAKKIRAAPEIWGALGPAGECAFEIKRAAFHPISLTDRPIDDYRERTSVEAQYACFLKDHEALAQVSARYGDSDSFQADQAFFAALEAVDISDLIRDINVWVTRVDDHSGDVSYSDLSDGERQLLMVLGLVRISRGKEALFLLDEPDTHLNPSWQNAYLELITEWTGVTAEPEKCQIIMSTHNPLTIASLEQEEVRVMSANEEGISVSAPRIDPRGLGFAGVLTDVFGMPSTLDTPTQTLIDQRNQLSAKSDPSAEDKEELERINAELNSLAFHFPERDEIYKRYLRQVDKIELANAKPLSAEEIENRDEATRKLLHELLGQK